MKEKLIVELEVSVRFKEQSALSDEDKAEIKGAVLSAAKLLKLRPKDLFGLLSMRRWIYKRDGRGSWIGYQDKVQQGLIRHSEHRYTDSSGTEQLRAQVYLTPKGITRLAQMVETEAGHA